jgi:flap endonuclease-1
MGIKHLNSFLKEHSDSSMKLINLSELFGKKIAVDISVYLYKYASENRLIENMYLMLAIFKYYNIIPIFIFDGKPPNEKKEILTKRYTDKKESEKEYNILKNLLTDNLNMDENERQEIICNMDILKKKFIYISKSDILNVKKLISSYGAMYYDAIGEADEVCAILSVKGKVWACLSEDMDMFVYGCPRVLRYFSLLNHTTIVYDMTDILNNLGITQKELREICIVSGTDYNNATVQTKNIPTLHKTLKYFKKYHKEKSTLDFYDWLTKNTNYINDKEMLLKIYKMFDLNENNFDIEDIKIARNSVQQNEINEVLKLDGFIFPIV